MRKRITREECIEALLEANQHVKKLSASNYSKFRKSPSVPTISRFFGGWINALKAAGIKPPYDPEVNRCSKEEATIAIENTIKQHGKYLTRSEYIREGYKPNVQRIDELFGSYHKALLSTGIYKCLGNDSVFKKNTEFSSTSQVAKALKCSTDVINKLTKIKRFSDYIMEVPNDNTKKGALLIANDIIPDMKKFYDDSQKAYDRAKKDPKYISLSRTKYISGKSFEELTKEVQQGKWDGKFLSIFRVSAYTDNEFPYVYFFEKKYVKEKYPNYFPLYQVAEMIDSCLSTLKSYELAGFLPEPKINNNVKFYNPEEVQDCIARHIGKHRRQLFKKSSILIPCFDYLNEYQQKIITDYIQDRKSGILIKYDGYTAKRMVSNPEKTFLDMQKILAICFFRIICGRLGITDIPKNYQLSQDNWSIYNPNILDVENITWNDYPSISVNRKSNTLIAYYNQLRTFYYWMLMKKEFAELNNQESNYSDFKKFKKNILSFLSQFPQKQGDLNPYETIKHKEKSFLTREQMISVKYLLLKDPVSKDPLRNATIWQLCCTTGLRPEEIKGLRIEYFNLTTDGYIKLNERNWGTLHLPRTATKQNNSPSHAQYGTLVPMDTVKQLNIYLKKVYGSQGNNRRGKGYLFRPHPLDPETPHRVLTKDFIGRIRPFLNFLQPNQQQDFILKSSRHSMNNLIMKANLPDKTIGAQTQKIAAQHQMRHAPEKLSVAEKYYLDDITQEEFYSVLNYTINFPWNKKEIALWEIQNGYRTISSTSSAEVPDDTQKFITKIKMNQEKEEFQQKKEMEDKISSYKNEIEQINKVLAQTTRPPKGMDIREFMFERKKLREKKEELEKIITHTLK